MYKCCCGDLPYRRESVCLNDPIAKVAKIGYDLCVRGMACTLSPLSAVTLANRKHL